jgi:hypothetical protein
MSLQTNNWLNLVVALNQKLVDELPGIIDEVNAIYTDDTLPYPADIERGISVEILQRKLEELPVVASFIYERIPVQDGENGWSKLMYPVVLEAYIGGEDKDVLNIQAVKWGIALCEFIERHVAQKMLLPGYFSYNTPKTDATYVLKKRDGYRQLISVVAQIKGPE